MYVNVANHRVSWCCQCLIYGYFVDPLREKGLTFKVDQMEMILGVTMGHLILRFEIQVAHE